MMEVEIESMSEICQVLDLGSGDYPVGTVNIDLYPKDTLHRHEGWVHTRFTPNFVNGDVLHLPFRDSVFELVTSSHVIEHVDDPILMLREMHRVSKHRVRILCPHRYGAKAKGFEPGMHKHYFSTRWFEQVLPKLGFFRVRVTNPVKRYWPTQFFHLFESAEEILTVAEVYK
jgi:ubiquinone/menaquinone biosynthesis C-methylase UbiE